LCPPAASEAAVLINVVVLATPPLKLYTPMMMASFFLLRGSRSAQPVGSVSGGGWVT
jgi:hypothetical protein